MNAELSLTTSTFRANPCELICPVISADRDAAEASFGFSETAESDMQRHIKESISRGCKGAEKDIRTNRIVCPLYGVSVDLNT